METEKENRADILISGAGIAGLALACILARTGFRVDIIDPAPPAEKLGKIEPSSRTIAMMEGSLNILKAAGIEDICAHYGHPLEAMRIIDDSIANGKPVNSIFLAKDIGLPRFGLNIPNNILRAALYEQAQSLKHIRLHVPGKLSQYTIHDDEIQAVLEDKTEVTAALIVGADGKHSRVREIAGIAAREKQYDQKAITCLTEHILSHNNTATEFHRPSGPLALVPLKQKQCSVVWVEKTERAENIMKLSKQDFERTLQGATNDILGHLRLASTPEIWPLGILQANSLTGERVVLIAEAAHVMSPITAQGLNLSLRDVAALAETIADAARAGLDIGSRATLEKYANRRIPDIKTRNFAVNSVHQCVSTDIMGLKFARRSGLKFFGIPTPFRSLAIRHGLAPEIDKGRLAQGLPL